MNALIAHHQPMFTSVFERLQQELASLRTGRANPAILDEIRVEAYDSVMELKGVASIMVQDAKTMLVQPWDKGLLPVIEKAIRDADIGINPAVDGASVRLNFPPMTEENRKKLVKIMKERCEDARVAMRKAREAVRDEISKKDKLKEIGEDEKFKALDEVDEYTKAMVAKIDKLAEEKEEDIMKV